MENVKKWVFMVLGIIFIFLGFVGVLLPIIPGIPFFLMGILFLAKGSRKFIKWLLTNKYIGKYIRRYRKNGISEKARNLTLASIWTSHVLGIIFIGVIAIKIVLLFMLLLVTWILFAMKPKNIVAMA